MAISISQYVTQYAEFLNRLLASGPDISDDLADLQDVRDALLRIIVRTSRRFGHSAAPAHAAILDETQWAEIRKDSTVQSLEQQVRDRLAAAPKKKGAMAANEGAFTDILTQLFQFFMAHPELLTLILSIFKKPA